MVSTPAEQARQALVALADLCPSAEQRGTTGSIPLDWFRWLPITNVSSFAPPYTALSPIPTRREDNDQDAGEKPEAWWKSRPQRSTEVYPSSVSVDRQFGERLAAVDQLRGGEHTLRVGWLFVAGTTPSKDGKSRRVFQPLVTIPVQVARSMTIGSSWLRRAGDVELTPLVADRAVRDELERQVEFGGGALSGHLEVSLDAAFLARLTRIQGFARRTAHAAGFAATEVLPAGPSPDVLMRRKGLVIVAGVAVYASTETGGLSHAASLRGWAGQPLDVWTAFHSMYVGPRGAEHVPEPKKGARTIHSPFLLTPVQEAAVRQSRTAALTVIKGAPGTGKSHTITALACDALARGETVLVAAKAEATVDALVDLFERAPGPRPVVFGSTERKDALAEHLAGGLHACDDHEREVADERLAEAVRLRDRWRASIRELLQVEALTDDAPLATGAALSWPILGEPTTDFARLARMIDAASRPSDGWIAGRRHRHAQDELDELTGARNDVQRADFVRAFEVVRAARTANQFVAGGGLQLGPQWEALREAEDHIRVLAAKWLALESRSLERLNHRTLGSVAALATALRSGRAARREQLARLDDTLTQALPLWAGTLADIDDLLPNVAGLFDVVVLDESSSIDQPTAASALLRGRRAVIVGDPKQLRHVSFLSDDQRDHALRTARIEPATPLAGRLDVRRNSTFDVAAGASTVITLDEHFRCNPHLMDFVAHRLYDGQVKVATRTPATESLDCVDLHRTDGDRNDDGVVEAEVTLVMTRLRTLLGHSQSSVGVVTPFRAQADALEAAVLQTFTVDEIEALDLRVGTVHAFQGNERDVVIISMGIGRNGNERSWAFVQDSHLFTVLVTRARRHLEIIYSADPPKGGLVADYLAQSDVTPGPPKSDTSLPGWAAGIARDLEAAGLTVVRAYPTGRHTIDVSVGDATAFFGIECGVHPDGADAHIDRHLQLRRQGWTLREAYQSRWTDRRGELIVELSQTKAE